MCNIFKTPTEEEIAEYFGLDVPGWYETSHDVYPKKHAPVIRLAGTGEYTIENMYWTLLPKSYESKKAWKFNSNNARGEELTTKPMHKGLLETNRCIVPMSGFYEYQLRDDGKKYKMYIDHKEKTPFWVAGLWQHWQSKDDQDEDNTFTVVTCAANEFMKPIHNAGANKHRMPVILDKLQADQWLSAPKVEALGLIQPCPDEWLAAHGVKTNAGKNSAQIQLV